MYSSYVNKSAVYQEVCCRYHPDSFLIEDYSAGDQICSECGLVVGSRVIDVSAEWRSFEGANSDPCRVGASEDPFFERTDYSTCTVALADTNASAADGLLKKTKKVDPLLKIIRQLREAADRIHLPRCIVDRAAQLMKEAMEQSAMKRSIAFNADAAIGACLFIACRENGCSRSFKEMASISNCSAKKIGCFFKRITNVVKVDYTSVATVAKVEDFIHRFACSLGVARKVQSLAIRFAERVQQLKFMVGRNPMTVAAASIYMAVEDRSSESSITIEDISNAFDISKSTIKAYYQQMLPHLMDHFPRWDQSWFISLYLSFINCLVYCYACHLCNYFMLINQTKTTFISVVYLFHPSWARDGY